MKLPMPGADDRLLAVQVNIGSLLLQQVAGDGRVSTEVDPRLSYDSGQILKHIKAHHGWCP